MHRARRNRHTTMPVPMMNSRRYTISALLERVVALLRSAYVKGWSLRAIYVASSVHVQSKQINGSLGCESVTARRSLQSLRCLPDGGKKWTYGRRATGPAVPLRTVDASSQSSTDSCQICGGQNACMRLDVTSILGTAIKRIDT